MNTVEQIEIAIDRLSPPEYLRLVEWWREREALEWDRQMNRDAASGKLDFLRQEARNERREGSVQEWPSSSE